jgi:hypothetical protein
MCVYILKKKVNKANRILGKVEKGFQKGRYFFETWGKDLENGFSQNLKGILKRGRLWECMCIGLECLCKVLDLKGKVVYNFSVSFVNFGEVGLDKLE